MLKCLRFGNYKKQYLLKKFDFLDKRSFFFLEIRLDEFAWWDARTSIKNFFRELGQFFYFKLGFGKFARKTKATFNVRYEEKFFRKYEGFVREKNFWKNIKSFLKYNLFYFTLGFGKWTSHVHSLLLTFCLLS